MYGSYQRWLIESAIKSTRTQCENRLAPQQAPRLYQMHRLDHRGMVVETRTMTPEERMAASPDWVTATSY